MAVAEFARLRACPEVSRLRLRPKVPAWLDFASLNLRVRLPDPRRNSSQSEIKMIDSMRRMYHYFLILCLFLSFILCGNIRSTAEKKKAEEAQILKISDVAVSTPTFNPSRGDRIALSSLPKRRCNCQSFRSGL